MKVSDLVKELNLTVFCGEAGLDAEISGGYTSDLLSDVMGHIDEGMLWVTMQTHQNIVAVATLKDAAAVLIVNGASPDEETLEERKRGRRAFARNAAFRIRSNGKNIQPFATGMKEYRVDLHLHTCLSPCGSLEMSPQRIVETALERGLDAIAVTDHNSTLQCPEIQALGEERGLMVFAGAEVTTREEAHCVALFADDRTRAAFQMYLDDYLPPVPNDPERFGDQVWVNARNEIVGEAPYLLISALDRSVEQIAAVVHRLGGLFIAAHVERPRQS